MGGGGGLLKLPLKKSLVCAFSSIYFAGILIILNNFFKCLTVFNESKSRVLKQTQRSLPPITMHVSLDVYVCFQACDNCIRVELGAIMGIIIGDVLATILIGVAVYSVALQPKARGYGSSYSKGESLLHGRSLTSAWKRRA